MSFSYLIFLIRSSTKSFQSIVKWGFQEGTDNKQTDIATYKLNRPRGQFSENTPIDDWENLLGIVTHQSCIEVKE